MTSPDSPAGTHRRTRPADRPAVAPPVRPGGPAAPPATDLDVAVDASGLHALRSAVAAHAAGLGATGDDLYNLLIVASELATNAIRHGGGRGRLLLWRTGDLLYCQVRDQGPGMADPAAGRSPPDPHQAGGRGLWITRRISQRLDVDSTGDGTVVTAVLVLPPR